MALSHGNPSAFQPESESLVSDEDEDEEEEEESEEELLALRRDGCVCGSVVGFSAGGHKRTRSGSTRSCSVPTWTVMIVTELV